VFDQAITVFSFVAIAIGLLASFAGGIGFFKAKRGDSIIKYQDKEIENYRIKIGELEKDAVANAAQKQALEDANQKLQENVDFLKDLKQGSPQLRTLTEAINNQTKLISKIFEKDLAA